MICLNFPDGAEPLELSPEVEGVFFGRLSATEAAAWLLGHRGFPDLARARERCLRLLQPERSSLDPSDAQTALHRLTNSLEYVQLNDDRACRAHLAIRFDWNGDRLVKAELALLSEHRQGFPVVLTQSGEWASPVQDFTRRTVIAAEGFTIAVGPAGEATWSLTSADFVPRAAIDPYEKLRRQAREEFERLLAADERLGIHLLEYGRLVQTHTHGAIEEQYLLTQSRSKDRKNREYLVDHRYSLGEYPSEEFLDHLGLLREKIRHVTDLQVAGARLFKSDGIPRTGWGLLEALHRIAVWTRVDIVAGPDSPGARSSDA